MFTVLEGEVELSFRGQNFLARSGETINVPANAPHGFRNACAVAATHTALPLAVNSHRASVGETGLEPATSGPRDQHLEHYTC
jgi:quercetin dioxygenase-like cupin family protein